MLVEVFLFVFYQSVLNEFRSIFGVFNLKSIDKNLQMLMPFKIFLDLSQMFSLAFFALKVALSIFNLPLIILFFVVLSLNTFTKKISSKISFRKSTANFQAVYKVQARFLC